MTEENPARDAPEQPAKARPSGPVPRTQAARREATSRKILDAAETLFSRHGRDGVTIKAVAAAVGVNTALIHYYYDDLERLFLAVWARRAAIINPVRLQALEDYERDFAGQLTAEGAVEAFLRPVLEFAFKRGEGWANFISLVGMTNTTRNGGARYMDEHFDTVVHRLLGLLRQIGPDVSDTDLFWFLHHLLGSLTFTMAQTGRINVLSGGACRSTDMEDALRTSVRIFGQGFKAL